jgi:hypothetical protein
LVVLPKHVLISWVHLGVGVIKKRIKIKEKPYYPVPPNQQALNISQTAAKIIAAQTCTE